MTERITDVATVNQDETPQGLVAMALREKADPAILSKLMDLQERWEANQAHKAYVEAMSAFKRDVPSVLDKDATVDFTSAKGRTHYKHASLGGIVSKITAAMSKHGLSAAWDTKQGPGSVTVTCHVTHSQGHRESVTLSGPPDDSGNKNLIQQIGSTVTYLQRYTLLAALGLATADQDDVDDREPVKMPTAKPEAAKAPAEPPADATIANGTLSVATSKRTSRGSMRYGLKIGDDWYNTFDDDIGKQGLRLKDTEVDVTFKVVEVAGKKYNDIISLLPANESAKATDEEVPF